MVSLLNSFKGAFMSDAERVISLGSHSELMDLVYNKSHLIAQHDTKFVKRGDVEAIRAYIDTHSLTGEAEMSLINLGNVELIEAYMRKYSLSGAGVYALKESKNRHLLKAFGMDTPFGYFGVFDDCNIGDLQYQSDVALINTNDFERIKRRIQKGRLSKDGELYLMEHAEPRVVKFYLEKYPEIPSEAKIAMIRRGIPELIMAFIDTVWFVDSREELAIAELGNIQLLAFLGCRHGLTATSLLTYNAKDTVKILDRYCKTFGISMPRTNERSYEPAGYLAHSKADLVLSNTKKTAWL